MKTATLALTPPQTVGPFFHGLVRARLNILANPQTLGDRIRIEGVVLDGKRDPVADAMVEIWQANAAGRYRHPADTREAPLDPAFTGFGRAATDDEGRFWFETIRPGRVPFAGRIEQALHINVMVFARGLLHHLRTRLYFPDDPSTDADPVLNLVPAARRGTLIATRLPSQAMPAYRFDIILQGEGETVFFEV